MSPDDWGVLRQSEIVHSTTPEFSNHLLTTDGRMSTIIEFRVECLLWQSRRHNAQTFFKAPLTC
jgi:hypothetical protein